MWIYPPGRVETINTIRYGAVVLDESRTVARAGPAVAQLLAVTAEEQGILKGDALSSLKERLRILVEFGMLPEEILPSDLAIRTKLEQMCSNRVDLARLDSSSIAAEFVRSMHQSSEKIFREFAPEDYRLNAGRCVKVHYDPGRNPWIASRLQDFFGMTDTPCICGGRLTLTLHLLAPNQRAVQVTQDLGGFWDRHYPSIRRELMRRYPKHLWPEDGRRAAPPTRR